MQPNFIDFTTNHVNLSGYSVILPSVCVGNVAQLAVDLIISTLQLKRVATVWHSAVIPIFGPRAFQHKIDDSDDSNDFTTACELFVDEKNKLACFQLRSPLVQDQMQSFFDNLIDYLQSQSVANVILLTSSYAHEQHNINASKFFYVGNEKFKANFAENLTNEDANWSEYADPVIHGGGFATQFYKRIIEKLTISCGVIFKYVSEGDNRSDASRYFEQLNGILSNGQWLSDGTRITMPISWKAVFGNDPTAQIY